MIKPEDVTIIIPHLGADEQQENVLDQCLESIKENSPAVISYIVAKNDGNYPCKHEEIAPIRLLGQGQCKAVNAAVATTNTPWIMVSNDDMVYAPGWFENLTAPINEGWTNSCYSPVLVEPRPGAPTFEVQPFGGAGGDFDKEAWEKFAKERMQNRKLVMGSGFNLPFLIKRDLWDMVGGYDINYDPWGSNGDSDLEYKIKLAGTLPMQVWSCVVYHFSQTSGTFNPENDSYRFRNYAYFKEKWGFDRTDDGIWQASFKIPTKEEGRIFNPNWEDKYES